ncbi:DUF4190 domain-containing protein [Priestia megaterium]|nr:DUF4190 domain-containing protein [Priestia megaterium]
MEDEQRQQRKNVNHDVYEADFMEETAAEMTIPATAREEHIRRTNEVVDGNEGKGYGRFALVLSILSLFFLPIILGAAGIILGFIARRRGAYTLGAWAIGIGAVSIIMGTFILPFF